MYTMFMAMDGFDKNRTRVKYCPCGKDNRDGKFSPFVGKVSEGYCHSCGKTFYNSLEGVNPMVNRAIKTPQPVSYIPWDMVNQSVCSTYYAQNNLFKYLSLLTSESKAMELAKAYHLGTSKHWQGATIFWQIDLKNKVRTGKIMAYEPNGKRVKKPKSLLTWVHAVIHQPNFHLEQCLFGEHLLKLHPTKSLAIVESEKTAMVAAAYWPDLVWLACGGKQSKSLRRLRMKELVESRTITLFPDLGSYEVWLQYAKKHLPESVTVSDFLEQNAPDADIQKGYDLADYLEQFNWSEFTSLYS